MAESIHGVLSGRGGGLVTAQSMVVLESTDPENCFQNHAVSNSNFLHSLGHMIRLAFRPQGHLAVVLLGHKE